MGVFILSNCPIDFAGQTAMSYFNRQPSTVKGIYNNAVWYYKRQLYTKLFSVFKFRLPQDWAENWFRFWLFQYGSIGIVYSHQYGWVCQPYSVLEFDYQYQPKIIMVFNAYFKREINGLIGTNAGIIKCFDDYYGFDGLVTRYAELLAQTERSLNVNLMNSNVSYLFEASSKKRAQEIKTAYEEATTGKPLVVLNEKVMDGNSLVPLLPNVKNNFIAGDLLEVRRGIMNAFLTEIGIRNVSVQKKERLTSGETNENNDETKAVVSVVKDNIQAGMDEINKISDLDLGVKLRYDYVSRETLQEGDVRNGSNNS